jgi:hypothetical protein
MCGAMLALVYLAVAIHSAARSSKLPCHAVRLAEARF